MRPALVVVITLCLSASAQEKEELQQLEGAWDVTALEVDGMVQPKDKTPKQIVITGKKLKIVPSSPEMTVQLDPTKKPKWIDLTFTKDDKPFTIRGIYEVKGNELTLCVPVAEKDKNFENQRPEDFETKGKFVALFKAKRAKGK